MYQGFVSILGALFLPMIWLYILKIPYNFTRITRRRIIKPFNCGFCLSFWIGFISLMMQTKFMDAIFISSSIPFIYIYVEDFIMNKWKL